MSVVSQSWLLSTRYIPHGHCYLWQTPLVSLHVAADALIAIAYFSIPLILLYFVRRVEELPFKNIFILFGAFILSCGTTHLLEIWVLWQPNYWIYGILKAVTALISLYTAFSLIPIVPIVIKLPSPERLEKLNQQLNRQVIEKETAKQEIQQLNQQLEQRVAEKTTALVKANQDLQESNKFKGKLADLTPNILYIYDLTSNKNIYCNPFITELLGYTPVELKKFRDGLIDELIHPEDVLDLKQHFANCLLLEDDKHLEVEYRIKNIKGQWHWLHDKNTIFSRNANGKPEQILGIAQDITQTKNNQFQTKELNQKLQEKISVLETRDRARVKLSQMNEFVQACVSLNEAQEVIADLLQPLFPGTAGVVYLMNNIKDVLEAIATWGNSKSYHNFAPEECWSIRRGNVHLAYPDASKLYCSHINRESELKPSLCLPMAGKGEIIGILHLSFFNSKSISQAVQDLAETVAQNLAMSFANLQLQQKLRYQSLRDPLTGLYNRRYLQESLGKELDRAHRKQQTVGVMMLDVDHFKRFNDIYGHSAGDLVLSQVGNFMLSAIRQYDIACRYGGEELIIVMPDASLENIIRCAERVREGIHNLELKHEAQQLESISVSIGLSCFPDDAINVDELIKNADKALYKAKESGRNCVMRC